MLESIRTEIREMLIYILKRPMALLGLSLNEFNSKAGKSSEGSVEFHHSVKIGHEIENRNPIHYYLSLFSAVVSVFGLIVLLSLRNSIQRINAHVVPAANTSR